MSVLNEMTVRELRLELLKAKKKIKELKFENDSLKFQMKVLEEKYLTNRQ